MLDIIDEDNSRVRFSFTRFMQINNSLNKTPDSRELTSKSILKNS